jgi:hypothetical protein
LSRLLSDSILGFVQRLENVSSSLELCCSIHIDFVSSYILRFIWSCGTPSKISNVGTVEARLHVTEYSFADFELEACSTTDAEIVLAFEVMWCVLNTFGDVLRKCFQYRNSGTILFNRGQIVMLQPIWMLRNLQTSRGKKIAFASVAGLVIIDIIFDIFADGLHYYFLCGKIFYREHCMGAVRAHDCCHRLRTPHISYSIV